jgi:hypothetical protein
VSARLRFSQEGLISHKDAGPVIHRKLSHGTRSYDGERFIERALSASHTCRLQGRPLLEHHSDLVNAPMRAATGWNWTGDVVDFRLAPQEYGATHFHDDGSRGWALGSCLRLRRPHRSVDRRLRRSPPFGQRTAPRISREGVLVLPATYTVTPRVPAGAAGAGCVGDR